MRKRNRIIFNQVVKKIGLDFGSHQLRVWTEQDGLIFNQPACLAVDTRNKQVLAVGKDAAAMAGRVAPYVAVHWPVKRGVIYDSSLAAALLRVALAPLLKTTFIYGPEMMASMPAAATQVEREQMISLLLSLGAREAYTIAQPLAASIGAGVPIADASGSFILQWGEGVVESAVISLGSMVAAESSYFAGYFLKEAVQLRVLEKHLLQISLEMSAKLIQKVVSIEPKFNRQILVPGKVAGEGNPTELRISSQDLLEPILSGVARIELLIEKLLANVPPELTVDVVDKGLLLSGGGAQLHGLDTYFIDRLGMPVAVVDSPKLAVINGVGNALEHIDEFKTSLSFLDTT